MEYNVKIESEPIGDKESLYLSITHNGSVWTSIRIVNPDVEIPQIIDVLQRYLTSAIHSDGDKTGQFNVKLKTSELPKWKSTSKF
jgi:hypothetical protein